MHILQKRFADAGLKDALIQSAVIAEGQLTQPYVESRITEEFGCISYFTKHLIDY